MKINKPITEDLTDVIEKKPYKLIGYLPLNTLENMCHVSRDKVIEVCNKHGIDVMVFKSKHCHIDSGAIVCWRDKELQKILNKHKNLLSRDGIPFKAQDYINYIMNNWIDEKEKFNSYNLCGFLFGDKKYIPFKLK